MTRAVDRDPICRHRQFPSEIIETCLRWYIAYRLSYRNLVTMMVERDVDVSPATIARRILRYLPELERRWTGTDTRLIHCSVMSVAEPKNVRMACRRSSRYDVGLL